MKGNKILIIDDDPRNIFALKATLEANGFEVLTASSAIGGIGTLKMETGIVMVLLDMMMPGMDGYEALPLISNVADGRVLPVIAVTAQAMKGDREKCLQAGAVDYIAKPIDVDTLLSRINYFLQ